MIHKKFTSLISFVLVICIGITVAGAQDLSLAESSESEDYLSKILDDFNLVPIETIWDIDFENHTLQNPHSGYVCDTDGVALSSSRNDSFQINSWSDSSSFEIAEYDGSTKNNGKSLKGVVNGRDQVQLNEFRSTISSNFAIFNYDYSTENLVSDEYIGAVRFYTDNGTTVDAPKIRLGGNGNLWIPHGVGVYKKLTIEEAKEWINVGIVYDFDSSMYYIYIDGVMAYSTDLSSYNIAQTNKLHIYTTGGSDKYYGEYWLDNFKVLEAKSRNSIVEVTEDQKALEITFKNNIVLPSVEDLEVKFGKNILSVASIDRVSDNKIRVNTNQEIFSGVYLDISIKDNSLNEYITYRYLTNPKDFDISGVEVFVSDDVVSTNATVVNSTGEARRVTMIVALKNENGDVISLSVLPADDYITDTEISLSANIGEATNVEVIFIDDLDNCRPVKNVSYEMALE